MNIPLHDLASQYHIYRDEINAAIQQVLDSTQFIMGQAVIDFEKSLATYLDSQHIVSCSSGTSALLLALMAIDLKPGDEVITTPFTFVATAEVVSLLGATPVFVDIEAETYNLDASQLPASITERTRAIIPVSLYGQPADMAAINDIAAHYSRQFDKKIFVIEDAAQSLGATYQGKKSGNLSDMGCLSFFPSKPLGCYGDGGAIVMNDDLLAEKMRSLRVHGQTKRYYHKYIGFNCRLDTLQAAILQVKLKYLDDEIIKRQRIANYYQEHLQDYDYVLPIVKPDRTSVYAQYSIRVKERDKVMTQLQAKQIPTAVHYSKPLHLQECFAQLGYQIGDFPVSEMVANEILSLPMSAFVSEVQQKYITNCLQDIHTQLSCVV